MPATWKCCQKEFSIGDKSKRGHARCPTHTSEATHLIFSRLNTQSSIPGEGAREHGLQKGRRHQHQMTTCPRQPDSHYRLKALRSLESNTSVTCTYKPQATTVAKTDRTQQIGRDTRDKRREGRAPVSRQRTSIHHDRDALTHCCSCVHENQ